MARKNRLELTQAEALAEISQLIGIQAWQPGDLTVKEIETETGVSGATIRRRLNQAGYQRLAVYRNGKIMQIWRKP